MAAAQQECSICMDSFKNPKLIPCHHSFCYKCLEDYVRSNLRNGRFDCPLCRRSMELPKEGVSNFQTNFYIETDYGVKFMCDPCGPNSIASIRCLDCEQNLCKSCSCVHERLKATRHHKLCDLATLDPEMKGKIQQRIFCAEHPEEEIKLVCKDCYVLMCVLCKAVSHDTHASKTIAEAAADVKKNLETRINQCTEKLRRLHVSTQKGKALEMKINDAEEEDIKTIQQHHSKLLDALNQEVVKMKEKLNNAYGELRKENAVFMKAVQDKEKNCSFAKEKAQELIHQGRRIEIIRKGPNIDQRIADAISKTDPTLSTSLEETLFVTAIIKPGELGSLIGRMRYPTRKIHQVKFGTRHEVTARFCQQQVPSRISNSTGASGGCVQEWPVSSTGESKLPREELSTIKSRLKQIIATRRNGLWATRLPHEYREKFGVEALVSLMDLVRHSFKDICKMELVPNTDRYIVYPVLEDPSKEKDLKTPEQDLLPIGEKITAYVTYIYSCGYFCVQKENSCVDQISEELEKDCKKKSAPNFELLEKGQFCAGLYSGDNCWTRGEIIDIKDSEPKIELLFVDYGNVDRVLSKDIRWLSEKTAEAPGQCISCSLHGIQPLENETIYSKASGEAFADIVRDKPIFAVARMHYDKVCEVELCLASDPDIGASEKLIQQGVVRSIFPEKSYHKMNETKEVVDASDADTICKVELCLVSDPGIGVSENLIQHGVICSIIQEKGYHEESKKEEVVGASDPAPVDTKGQIVNDLAIPKEMPQPEMHSGNVPFSSFYENSCGKTDGIVHADTICKVELCLVSDPSIGVSENLIQHGVIRSIIQEKGYHEESKKEEVVDASDPAPVDTKEQIVNDLAIPKEMPQPEMHSGNVPFSSFYENSCGKTDGIVHADTICKVELCLVSDPGIGVSENLIQHGVIRSIIQEKGCHEESKKEEVVDASDPAPVDTKEQIVNDLAIPKEMPQPEMHSGNVPFSSFYENSCGKTDGIVHADAVDDYLAHSAEECCMDYSGSSTGQFERVQPYYFCESASAMETSESDKTKVKVVNSISKQSSDVFRNLFDGLKRRFRKGPVSKNTP